MTNYNGDNVEAHQFKAILASNNGAGGGSSISVGVPSGRYNAGNKPYKPAGMDIYHNYGSTFESRAINPLQPTNVITHGQTPSMVWDYGDEAMFGDIWFSPLTISMGFIVEDSIQTITMWNSSQFDVGDFTSINITNEPGTELEDISLPIILPRNKERSLELTVLEVGPPLQDTTYDFVISGTTYSTYISGLRILPIKPEPNWEKGIELECSFVTAIFKNERLYEQRRPLADTFEKSVDLRFLNDTIKAQKFWQEVLYGQDKVFAVPYYHEAHMITSATPGQKQVTFLRDTTYDWFLNNVAQYVVISDHENFVSEIKEIDTISTNSINCVDNISKTLDTDYSVLYPVYFGIIKNVNVSSVTRNVDKIRITFVELSGG